MAEADPPAVARALARGMSRQTVGAKLAVLRRLADALSEGEPSLFNQLARDLGEKAYASGR